MAPEVILDNEHATLWYRPDTRIVHHQIHKFVHGDSLRNVLNQGLEPVKLHKAQKWLSDDRANSALTPDDTTWAQTVWFPQVVAAGWKHWAVVMPEKVVGQLNMKQWVTQYKSLGINSQVFADPDEALKWLAAQP
ncbi:MAG TPA: hypothetical protein VF337_07735 [Candidatus Limnocylindrales bacterium]